MSEIVFFWKGTGNGWLSNWSPHSFVENDVRFFTAEHYLMYHKALVMGDNDAANRILVSPDPKVAKAVGRKIKNWDEQKWVSARSLIMERALLQKVEQNLDLKQKLLETGTRVLAEASPYDAIWGIGCSKTDPRAKHIATWPGLNLLGEAWMHVRSKVIEG